MQLKFESSMISRRKSGSIVARAALGILAATMLMPLLGSCGSDGAEVRYRVTVEVATPDGLRSGSSVWSSYLSKPTVALATAYDGKFRGEAVAVDLPDDRVLFALVKDQSSIPRRHFRHLFTKAAGSDHVLQYRDIARNVGATAEIPCEQRTGEEGATERFSPRFDCPMLVTFTDMTDPTSVVRVEPDDLAASFGPGYGLKSITVQITGDPVTTGIEGRLGWLSKMEAHDFSKDGPFYKSYPVELLGLRNK